MLQTVEISQLSLANIKRWAMPVSNLIKRSLHFSLLLSKSLATCYLIFLKQRFFFFFFANSKGTCRVRGGWKNANKPLAFLQLIRLPPCILCFTLRRSWFPLQHLPCVSFKEGCLSHLLHSEGSTLSSLQRLGPVKFNGEAGLGVKY